MKRIIALAGSVALMLAMATVSSTQGSQRPQDQQGHTRRYDPKTETTIQGVVEKVEQVTSMMSGNKKIRLTLKSDTKTLNVRLGPAAFVEKTMTFKEGDKVEVTGSRITRWGKPMIIARQVKKGGQTLKLREATGAPLWKGQFARVVP